MDKLIFQMPTEHSQLLIDLHAVPFAKTEDGYRFAHWIYDLNNTEEKQENLLESKNGKKAAEFSEKALADLRYIVVSEDDYLSWTVHKKDAGGIARYHKVMQDLTLNLLLLAIDCTTDGIVKEAHNPEKVFYTVQYSELSDGTKQVLNRNNPFADVTIKSQQFFYKAADGATETLFFNTNNIVEKMEKNGRDMLTMRPGFTVTKEHGVVQRPMQKVTFSNSLTEPIVGDEDHIYIHID